MPTPRRSTTIDLNNATEATIIKKLNISERLARRIIALRPYQSLDQLQRVWGLDPETLERITRLIHINEADAAVALPVEPPVLPAAKTAEVSLAAAGDSASEHRADPKTRTETAPKIARVPRTAAERRQLWTVGTILMVILLVGAYFRLTGLNWDEGQHQHPDERFISMVTEQIRGVDGVSAYFNTQESSLNPLQYGSYTYGMFPLFFTRMVAERLGMTDYDRVPLVGRAMSGFFDLLSVLMLYFLGKRLYNKRIGILAAALGAAAVLPIQLSHYFTVDSFSTIFVVASIYFATLAIPISDPDEKISQSNLVYFGLFGFIVGLAGACKINTLPVFGMIFLLGLAKIITDWNKPGFRRLLAMILSGWALAAVFLFISFRVFQPYAFAGPGFFNLSINERWLAVIKEVIAQVAGNSDWPPNTHWTNRGSAYAWSNMVNWGLGIPLGLAGWFGFLWVAVKIWKGEWRSHLLPFIWVAAYFIWQNGQFWRYMRYFLPIYPFIILFAAWALVEIYDRTSEGRQRLWSNGRQFAVQLSDWRFTWKAVLALLVIGIVVFGTYAYAFAFTRIYNRPMTRIAASEWILNNISGPMNVKVSSADAARSYPVSIDNRQVLLPDSPGFTNINIVEAGKLSEITTTDIRQVGVSIYFRLTRDEEGNDLITEGRLAINDDDQNQRQEISFGDVHIPVNATYYFHYKIHGSSQFSLSNISLRNVDEGEGSVLPVDLAFDGQAAGLVEGTLPLQPSRDLTLNRLTIENFHQVFVPTQTTVKVNVFKAGAEDNSLAESSQTIMFSEPGMRLAPTFSFPAIELAAQQAYQIRYEVTQGAPVRILGENYTLETSWDDALPLNIDKYNAQGGIYNPLNLELYEPDTPQKREAMLRVLSESNYIVIPSNRAYDSMPRLPQRYPLTLKYYQLLFDCECSGDAMENIAYGLKPPFKSPLGFDLVEVFESPPTLSFVTFPDQAADESFTVYDHPKVLIFKKSADFSIDRVRAAFNSVNLDEVFFQTPKQYTQVPTAMQLPADRLSAQTQGGTWSKMFDRNSWINQNEVLGGAAWYLLLFLLGLMVFPFTFRIFSSLPDRGYPLMRMAGLLLMAWLAWFLGSLKILSFSRLSLWLYFILVLWLGLIFAYRQREELIAYFRSQWRHILATELIFLIVFLYSLSVRLGNPDLWHPWLGGEKPMDFAFFNAVIKSVYFPPEHPWFSGHYINYYYYGFVIAAVPTKMLGVLPSIAYNLILPSWFAMTGIGLFAISFNLVSGLRTPRGSLEQASTEAAASFKDRWLNRNMLIRSLPYLAGIIALIAVLFLGNLYEVRVLWKYLPEVSPTGPNDSSFFEHGAAVLSGAKQVLTGAAELPGGKDRWYFEASRPILHEGPDTPIAEFPYFTFLYGDMHPHLLIMPFYALVFGLMLNFLLSPVYGKRWSDHALTIFAAGLFFGVFRASHTWDFPTFLGLGGLVIAWNIWRLRSSHSMQNTIQRIIIYEAIFAGITIAMYAPFTHWFKTEYASVERWMGARTPLTDYLIVFGLPIFVIISLMLRDLAPKFSSASSAIGKLFRTRRLLGYLVGLLIVYLLWLLWTSLWLSDYQVLAFGLPLLAGMAYLVLFDDQISLLRKVIWVLFGAALFITLFVEVFVLKGDGGRSNTVFRFYNQAWFFFGLAISAALVDLFEDLTHWAKPIQYVWAALLAILFLSAASYPILATGKKMTDRWPDIQTPPHTLDGAAFMLGDTDNPEGNKPAIYNDNNRFLDLSKDYSAILYMQDHITGSPVFVEGHTEEYRWGSRFSIYTGLPSVVGWSWHVRQHNSLLDGAIVDHRIDDVNNFYNTEDVQAASQFLDHYHVRYIVVGDLERAYYSAGGMDKFNRMVDLGALQIIFGDNSPNTTTIFEVLNVK